MFNCCSFDPRRHSQFPYYHLTDKLNLTQKRNVAGGCYELWQVHKKFSLEEFQKMVAQLPGPKTTPEKKPIVRIVCMFSGRCTVNVYDSQQQTYCSFQLFCCRCRCLCPKTDHKAVVAYSTTTHFVPFKTRSKKTFRRRSPAQNASFLHHMANPNVTDCTQTSRDTHKQFQQFYNNALYVLNYFILLWAACSGPMI